jgi:hypothetical protein
LRVSRLTNLLIDLPTKKKIAKTINASTILGSRTMKLLIMLSILSQTPDISALIKLPLASVVIDSIKISPVKLYLKAVDYCNVRLI